MGGQLTSSPAGASAFPQPPEPPLPPLPAFAQPGPSGFSSTEQPIIKTKKANAELDRITSLILVERRRGRVRRPQKQIPDHLYSRFEREPAVLILPMFGACSNVASTPGRAPAHTSRRNRTSVPQVGSRRLRARVVRMPIDVVTRGGRARTRVKAASKVSE